MKYLTTKENYKKIPFEVFAPFVPNQTKPIFLEITKPKWLWTLI
jgi:hypothetical protein